MEERFIIRLNKMALSKRTTQTKTGLGIEKDEFLSLYQQNVVQVYRYIFSRVGNHAEAEDITSQVFLDALNGIGRLDHKKNFKRWVFSIARNKVVDSYRQQKGVISLDSLTEIPAESKDLLADLIQNETRVTLERVLSKFEPDQLELLRLRYAGGLSYRQIGDIFGKTEAAVKMANSRLISRLKAEMEQNHE